MKISRKELIAFAIIMFLCPFLSCAENEVSQPVKNTSSETLPKIQWWREAKFGLFIHWGPVSLRGTEISWSRGGKRRGPDAAFELGAISPETYDNLFKKFNPTKFNAKEWVAIARASGAKYLIFTTKHHDGFCMFDSKLTEYKITNSPFKRDVSEELAKACHESGLKLGFYYSLSDWHHPDYMTENHDSGYIPYMRGQLRELCTKYGKVDIVWFDGISRSWKDWDAENLIQMIQGLQPEVIINDRTGLPADFDTVEQQLGNFQNHRQWESCITMGSQWAWKPKDKIKSFKECIRLLVSCAGGDGNLLLNVGPMSTGKIEPRQVRRLKEIGDWLKKYGQSIYGTRGGPFKPGFWGASTYKGNTIYLFIFPLDEGEKVILLPSIGKSILGSLALTGEKVNVKQTDKGIEITISAFPLKGIVTIIALQLDGLVADIDPVDMPNHSE